MRRQTMEKQIHKHLLFTFLFIETHFIKFRKYKLYLKYRYFSYSDNSSIA